MSLAASGRWSGLAVDVGDSMTCATPVYHCHSLPYASRHMKVAGRDITNQLRRSLQEKGTCVDLATARSIKELLCYVAMDYDQELSRISEIQKTYELPDGNTVSLANERFKCTEMFFTPFLHGGTSSSSLQQVVSASVTECDTEFQYELFNNIVLSGGSTMFPGMAERLRKTLCDLRPYLLEQVKVIAPPERKLTVWIGGSVLSSISSFSQEFVSKDEYSEYGPSIIKWKCF